MKRRSWIILAACVLLAVGFVIVFLVTQNGSERLTEQGAIDMMHKVETAFRKKDANGVLAYISPTPDTRIASINQDQLRLLLVRYFRSSDNVSGEMKNYAFTPGDTDATLQFDLVVHNNGPDSRKEDYSGHITLHLRRVEIPHLLGLYQTKEWRIASAETTGPELSTFGD
jgi:hypothetical protein